MSSNKQISLNKKTQPIFPMIKSRTHSTLRHYLNALNENNKMKEKQKNILHWQQKIWEKLDRLSILFLKTLEFVAKQSQGEIHELFFSEVDQIKSLFKGMFYGKENFEVQRIVTKENKKREKKDVTFFEECQSIKSPKELKPVQQISILQPPAILIRNSELTNLNTTIRTTQTSASKTSRNSQHISSKLDKISEEKSSQNNEILITTTSNKEDYLNDSFEGYHPSQQSTPRIVIRRP